MCPPPIFPVWFDPCRLSGNVPAIPGDRQCLISNLYSAGYINQRHKINLKRPIGYFPIMFKNWNIDDWMNHLMILVTLLGLGLSLIHI